MYTLHPISFKQKVLLGAFIVLLFFLGAMVFFAEDRFDRLEKTLAQQTTDISLLRAQLGELRVTTESLVSDASESTKQDIEKKLAAEREKLAQVEKKLAAESAARSKAESELKKTSSVSDTRISEVEKNLSSLNIEPIVSSWRPRTAYLECSFKGGKSSGSGVLMNFEKGTGQVLGVLTNQHVLVVNNVVADSCTVTFPDYTDKITVNRSSGDIEVSSEGLDFGRLVIRNAPASLSLRAASKTNTCSAKPAVGSELVILGYPNIGTSGDITATEGIVSGTDGDFYITSAKIERGNSGGPAVLVKDNCLVGIPTFVTVGVLEALARVLDVGVIYR